MRFRRRPLLVLTVRVCAGTWTFFLPALVLATVFHLLSVWRRSGYFFSLRVVFGWRLA
jgi:hypothetical protein